MKRKLSLFIIYYLLFIIFITHAQTGGISAPPALFTDALNRLDTAFSDTELSSDEAYYLGRAVAANILSIYRPYNANPELTLYLNKISMVLAINSQEPILFNGYHVMILDSPEFNAFATPGGHIFITRGLLELCTTEDMLAAIIAHEMAHIMLRHGSSIIESMGLTRELADIANSAAALAGNTDAARRTLLLRQSVAGTVDTLILNGYSQSQEFEADREALILLADAGYNPWAMMELLRVLNNVQNTRRDGFNSTHPSPEYRIQNITPIFAFYGIQNTGNYRELRFR